MNDFVERLRRRDAQNPNLKRDRAQSLYPYASDAAFEEFLGLYEGQLATRGDNMRHSSARHDDADWDNMAGLAWKGNHSKRDPAKALQHFTAAAGFEFPDAMYNLARGWEEATFGAVDKDKASAWYRKAAALYKGQYGPVHRPGDSEIDEAVAHARKHALYRNRPMEAFNRACDLVPANNDLVFREFMELYHLYGIDPSEEVQNKDEWRMRWLAVAGLLHLGTSSKCSPIRALENFLAAAERGSTISMYDLGRGWEFGWFGRIDMDRAHAWYKKAYDLGRGEAGAQLFNLMRSSPRYAEKEFRHASYDIIERSAALGSDYAYLKLAMGLAEQNGPTKFDQSKEMYERLIADNRTLEEPASIVAALCLSLRYYLGFGVEQDFRKSASYARQVVECLAEGGNAVDKNAAQRLVYLTTNTNHYGLLWARAKQAVGAESAWSIVQGLYGGRLSEAEVTRRLINGSIKSSGELCDCFWAAVSLAEYEGRPQAPLRNLKRLAENRLLGITTDQVVASTEDFGPLFNKRNQLGFPIPGVLLDAPELTNGMGEVVGLIASKGEIEFQFLEPRKGIGPLLTPEDINVALALTFGGEKPIWPGFSLDPVGKRTPDQRRYEAQEKDWKPSWLGNTLFGKTMYAADYWMAGIVWRSRQFEDAAMSPEGRLLLERMALSGGRDIGLMRRVLLRPAAFHRSWVNRDDGRVCQIHKAQMEVFGAFIDLQADGTEDRFVAENDTRFSAGRAANILTAEYDKLCRLWPVFERMRQLMALLYALNGLRKKGFVPSAALQNRIASIKRLHVERREPPYRQRLIWKLET